jgi:hypothetical protein
MTDLIAMLAAHPKADAPSPELAEVVAAASECAQVCLMCADACANETPPLGRCTRADIDCADVCRAVAAVFGRLPMVEPDLCAALLEACVLATEACAAACADHAHEHCRRCEAACRRCTQACLQLREIWGPLARSST